MLLGGFEPQQAYIIHFIAITIGHLNHANIKISWGVFKYIFNNPIMHLYHHAKLFPENFKKGVNFGISLSCWDYLFKTAYVPDKTGMIDLGWEGDDDFSKSFFGQLFVGFTPKKRANKK
jgi:sterol desaturase/sphingolipid hydroxylase (fatty acid hydroxylase superfamily)